ncbi:MAG: signal recognition particle-docking protein FtsY [bacterium]
MSILNWIELSYKNGELFFYIIPLFLLVMLVIVILVPDKEKGSKVELKSDVEKVEPKEEKVEKESEGEVEKTSTVEEGLSKTKAGFISKLKNLFKATVVDASMIEELEEILYTSDMGVETVSWLINEVTQKSSAFENGNDVREFIKEKIKSVFYSTHKNLPDYSEKPAVFLVVGVNGAGKTTTIGKLASKFVSNGKQCTFAAADTFRAAAVEQLKVWAERTDSQIISDKEGADPASVAFNAINSGRSKGVDYILIDTAGRLQNRANLMEELSKINRVIGKVAENAPHETLLVIDANNGQNAFLQARQFSEAVNVTGIIVTKLDGTAKGGVVVGIAKELSLPVYFVGVGEKIEDLKPFNPEEYVEVLFS